MTALSTVSERAPEVSIVVPVHNGERFLDEAIQSLRNQTLASIEILVVDDGSTDSSMRIAERHAAVDTRVRIQRLARSNFATALNWGIRSARAPWIGRLDADDVALPEWLERQMCYLTEHPDVGALGAFGWMMGSGGNAVGLSRHGPVSREEFLRARTEGLIYLLHSSVVFPRDLVLSLGGYREEYGTAADVDLWSRIADNHQVLALPEPLIQYRIHRAAASLTRSEEQIEQTLRARYNALRRRAREPELSLEDYRLWYRSQPIGKRVRRRLATRSQYCYRYGGSLLADRCARGLLWIGLSCLLYPPLPLARFRQQRVFWMGWARARGRLESWMSARSLSGVADTPSARTPRVRLDVAVQPRRVSSSRISSGTVPDQHGLGGASAGQLPLPHADPSPTTRP